LGPVKRGWLLYLMINIPAQGGQIYLLPLVPIVVGRSWPEIEKYLNNRKGKKRWSKLHTSI